MRERTRNDLWTFRRCEKRVLAIAPIRGEGFSSLLPKIPQEGAKPSLAWVSSSSGSSQRSEIGRNGPFGPRFRVSDPIPFPRVQAKNIAQHGFFLESAGQSFAYFPLRRSRLAGLPKLR